MTARPSSATSWRLSNAPNSGSSFLTGHTAEPYSTLVCRPLHDMSGVSTCVKLSQPVAGERRPGPIGSLAGAVTVTPTACVITTNAGSLRMTKRLEKSPVNYIIKLLNEWANAINQSPCIDRRLDALLKQYLHNVVNWVYIGFEFLFSLTNRTSDVVSRKAAKVWIK